MPRLFRSSRSLAFASIAAALLLVCGYLQPAKATQTGVNPLTIFQNYFLTGDYVVAGWRQGAPDGSGYAPGTVNFPDVLQPSQAGIPTTVPVGADIVAAYLYWATVESSTSAFAGQKGYFNGYPITGTVLGNPNAPTSWSAGGCSGSAQGSKTMRTYRADVHPFLPLDTSTGSPTFGATVVRGRIPVRLADSGKNGNSAPIALGATLIVIYRVLSPSVPLNAIVLYDGVYAPSNAGLNMSQNLTGFYQPATSPAAKITHIVANGQSNKSEQVYLNNAPLPSLYGATPPFPGIYNGSWDNPTWVLSAGSVKTTDTSETTSVVPTATNSGCVSWGAVILSTTVQDSDGDGLLDVWENNQGYTDAVSGQWIPLPGANPNAKDIFVELDWLNDLDGSAGLPLHSHLPKEDAIDTAGGVLSNQGIRVHFDLGPNVYQGDPFVVSGGTGGNAISEGSLVCTDGAVLCAYPNQPAIGWKGGFESIKNSNFQSGRAKSYHYILSGHAMGSPFSYWSAEGATLDAALVAANPSQPPALPELISVVNSGNTATVTLASLTSEQVTNPGDCPNPAISACSNANNNRISITGALNQTALNGSYVFSKVGSKTANGVTTTTFTIQTQGVASGTYNYSAEPQLAVTYLGPTSTSGQSEFGGGGDSAMTLGLWGADDPANCQPDPSQPGPVYCNNEVGTPQEQAGTLLHELGHSLSLTHGGMYFTDLNNPSLPTYELNCKPNYLSVMNYLFQVRGFPDGGIDYSSQKLASLNEAGLSESAGIGAAAHQTRWYSTPNAVDKKLGHVATSHCDGSPLGPNDVPAIRVDGSVPATGQLDWNNDLIVPDAVAPPGVDVNYNGITGDAPFLGFDDSLAINLQQIGAREGPFGSSGGVKFAGGGVKFAGGGVDNDGGGVKFAGGGVKFAGGGVKFAGGGIDQDEDTATSTADPATGLTCAVAIGIVPGCVQGANGLTENGKNIPLTWRGPSFGQTRSYTIYRATGSFGTAQLLLANLNAFSAITTLNGAPPTASYTDTNLRSGTYTYFVTSGNKQGAQSGASNLVVVTIKSRGGDE